MLTICRITLFRFILPLLIISVLFNTNLYAASFEVSPNRIFMENGNLKNELTVINKGVEKVTVQLTAFKWSQDEKGEDLYEPTNDVIFFPKIVTIDKEKEKIIRVGLQGSKKNQDEETYRLFIEEIPLYSPFQETQVVFALKIGVPIFIPPNKKNKKVIIDHQVSVSGGVVLLTIINKGNSHFIVENIKAIGMDKEEKELYEKEVRGWYQLHGISRSYKIKLSEKECMDTNVLHLKIMVKDKALDHKITLDRNSCKTISSPPL